MTPLENALILFLCLLAGSLAGVWMYGKQRIGELQAAMKQSEALQRERLQLGAYERLLIFAERTRIPNMVQRLNQPNFSVQQLQQVMVQSLRDEFEHNITQQLYIRPELWDAISKLKEQNAYLINEIARKMPPGAPGTDLSKALLQLHSANQNATLNQTVTDAIHFEVKQLLQQL
jgi:hypothetical protein